jgi:hypothetical protein
MSRRFIKSVKLLDHARPTWRPARGNGTFDELKRRWLPFFRQMIVCRRQYHCEPTFQMEATMTHVSKNAPATYQPGALVALLAIATASLCCAGAPADVPSSIEAQMLLASDGIAHDGFGKALDRESQTLIVGAPQHFSDGLNGSFYVFAGGERGQWIEQERIFSPFDAAGSYGDEFGSALALEGDTLLVGAPLTPENGSLAGRAYVFSRDETGHWTYLQTLPSPSSPRFGQSIALAGDTAVITSQYQAYIFTRDASGLWSQDAELSADTVGTRVVFDGQTLVVYGRFNSGDVGGVIFTNQDGAWAPSATISMPTTNPYTFARDVSLDSNQLAMGVTDLLGQDRAFVYERDESGAWMQQAMLDPDSLAGDSFGNRVALTGDLLLVSAPGGGLGGKVHVYQRNRAAAWMQTMQLIPSDSFFGQYFGGAIHFDEDIPIIGSRHHQNGLHAGAAYVFDAIPTPVSGDITGDGVVNINDLLAVINAWGPCAAPPENCPADLTRDGQVNVNDLLTVINSWG